jgi:hypothetical protein
VTGERWVLLGLAPARAGWFRDVAQWVSSAAVAAEFVKCVSAEEVRARLASGRRWSALVVDTTAPAFDRDLVAAAGAVHVPVIAVGDGRGPAWDAGDLGVASVLPPTFGRDELLDALARHARMVGRGDELPAAIAERPASPWRGRLVAVCGTGGTGASTLAAATAQGLAGDVRYGRGVVLADLALRADQAMLHDAVDLGPGLQELVELHRLGQPGPAEIAAHTFDVAHRGYRLLLGLRRPSAWSALRPRATDAALDGLRRTFQVVVADITGDFESESDGGSVEVEERNHLALATATSADLVVAVGLPGLKGVHSLAWLLRSLAGAGVEAGRIVPVVNRARRDPRRRAEMAAALAGLAPATTAVASPLWLRERKVEDAVRDGVALPAAIVEPLTSAVAARLERHADAVPPQAAPARIAPGSLGTWAQDA